MAKKTTKNTKNTTAAKHGTKLVSATISTTEPAPAPANELRIGLIGYGFMGRAHANAIRQVPHFFKTSRKPVLQAVCGRDEPKVREFAAAWDARSIETDWRKLVARDDIDAVDICTPNDSHMEIALACVKHGKMILCEKPLALDGKQGEAMVKAVEKAKLPNLVWYNYRFLPAVTLAKNIVDAGELGKVFHYRANFLQDWTISADLPQGGTGLWRLDAKVAGSGVTGDLLAHCIDTARWINGDIVAVSAMTETFIKERVHTATGKKQPVKIDDACAFLARFENGSMAVFESTRYARGHKALYTFEINGEKKSLAWDLHDLNRLSYFDHGVPGDRRGWSSIHCTDGDHPYAGKWWVPGLCLGYEHSFAHGLYEFLTSLDAPKSEKRFPDFRHALGTQYVCDAVLEAARTGKWTKVKRA
ncbi:MAG: Gfo/Idh/MocA family oxidoreductase [Planctomycetaceae bacterium]|nr:Gfo/Idh/MocA family oxidoreductase [Planctomycetaceae bacterium]